MLFLQKLYFFLFLSCKCEPLSRQQSLAFHWLGEFANSRHAKLINDQSLHEQQDSQLLLLNNYTPHMISYVFQNRWIYINYQHTLHIYHKEFTKCKNRPHSLLSLDPFIFIKIFEIHLVTQSLYFRNFLTIPTPTPQIN